MEILVDCLYVITLLWVTGFYSLFIEVQGFKVIRQKKEQGIARLLGWVNIVLGILVWIGVWVYQTFIW